MAFARPTLNEIIDRIVADMSSRVLGIEGAVLRRSILGVIARTQGGAVHLLYGYLDWIARQVIPDTADAEYLERWAAIWGLTRKAADYAAGHVIFTGTNGSVIPAGTIVQRQDGVQYEVQTEATISGGTATTDVEALVAGDAGNLDEAERVFLLSPITGVTTSATVGTGGIVDGLDTESDTRLRARLLARIQEPPQGGSTADYEQWALAVSGVTRVWVTPNGLGLGTVLVHFVRDDDVSIIPDSGEVADVQDYIDERRPVTADVTVAAPTADALDLTIQLSPNNATVRAAVTAELTDLLRRDAEPGGTILISRIREAVSVAAGESDNVVVTPTADVTHATGHIAVLGTITFSTL